MSFAIIPVEIVAHVIESFASHEDIIQRRKLGPAWYRRYWLMLPRIANDFREGRFGLPVEDEDLVFDILSVNGGDLQDAPDLDKGRQSKSLTMLGCFVAANMNQSFGWRLTKLPVFAINLTIWFSQFFAWLNGSGNLPYMTRERNRRILRKIATSTIKKLIHFDGLAKVVLLPWIRRHPEHRVLLLSYVDNALFERLLLLFDQHRVGLREDDVEEEILKQNDALSENNKQALRSYRWLVV